MVSKQIAQLFVWTPHIKDISLKPVYIYNFGGAMRNSQGPEAPASCPKIRAWAQSNESIKSLEAQVDASYWSVLG